MPICINLLAEQQAAEEARRRDPVKRAIWLGSALAGLMVLWILSLQLRVASAKTDLARYEAKLQAVEENSKEVLQNWATSGQLEGRLANLQRYSTNRFFSASVLEALQQVVVDDIRVMHLQSGHSYSTNAEAIYKTNFVFPVASKRSWQFWKSRVGQTNLAALVNAQVAAITGKVEALKTPLELITKTEFTTNGNQVAAKVDIIKPAAAIEQIHLTIHARDYSNPPGKRVDQFSKAIATNSYFAQRLRQGEEGISLRERAIQPEVDNSDPLNPGKPFVPFVIECRFRDTHRANE